jgi:hypothetical protein
MSSISERLTLAVLGDMSSISSWGLSWKANVSLRHCARADIDTLGCVAVAPADVILLLSDTPDYCIELIQKLSQWGRPEQIILVHTPGMHEQGCAPEWVRRFCGMRKIGFLVSLSPRHIILASDFSGVVRFVYELCAEGVFLYAVKSPKWWATWQTVFKAWDALVSKFLVEGWERADIYRLGILWLQELHAVFERLGWSPGHFDQTFIALLYQTLLSDRACSIDKAPDALALKNFWDWLASQVDTPNALSRVLFAVWHEQEKPLILYTLLNSELDQDNKREMLCF